MGEVVFTRLIMGNLKNKIIILLTIGLLFRLFIIYCLPVRTFDNTIKRYHNAAVNLIEARGYSHFDSPPYRPSFYKPPVYSIFLAVIYKLFGINIGAVKIIQALADTFACLLLFYLLRLYFNEKIALVGLGLAAICPITAVYANLINPESLSVFFMVLSLFLVSKAARLNKSWLFFCSGLSSIVLGYLRLELSSLVFIFGAYLFFNQKKRDKKKILFYVLGVLMMMTPWVARNYRLTGKFIPLSAGGGAGFSVFYGTFDYANRDVASLEKFYKENPDIQSKISQWYKIVLYSNSTIEEKNSIDRELFKSALHIIRQNPWRYLFGRVSEIPRVWINLHADEFAFLNNQDLRMFHPDFNKVKAYAKDSPKAVCALLAKYVLLFIIMFYILMAVKGLWVIRSKASALLLFILPLIYVHLFFLFIQISANFTVPFWICMIFFSAIGLYSIFSKTKPNLRVC